MPVDEFALWRLGRGVGTIPWERGHDLRADVRKARRWGERELGGLGGGEEGGVGLGGAGGASV